MERQMRRARNTPVGHKNRLALDFFQNLLERLRSRWPKLSPLLLRCASMTPEPAPLKPGSRRPPRGRPPDLRGPRQALPREMPLTIASYRTLAPSWTRTRLPCQAILVRKIVKNSWGEKPQGEICNPFPPGLQGQATSVQGQVPCPTCEILPQQRNGLRAGPLAGPRQDSAQCQPEHSQPAPQRRC